MAIAKSVKIQSKTYAVLKSASRRSGIPITRIITKAFGTPAKVKRVCEY